MNISINRIFYVIFASLITNVRNTMAQKEEVLQKVNEYCNERQYTSTLDEVFIDKFSEKFAVNHVDANIDEIVDSIKFNIDTAFSAASKGIERQSNVWKTKESEYLKQLEELKKVQEVGIPDEIKQQINELKEFKEQRQREEKISKVFNISKAKVREDLHENLKNVLDVMKVDYNASEEDIAKELTATFTKLYKDKIGDVKPASSGRTNKDFDELLNTIPKINVF